MICKERFRRILSGGGNLSEQDWAEIDASWDEASECAACLDLAMPGIGFFSRQKRLAAFFAVCRHLDQIVDSGQLTESDGQFSLQILRLSNPAFNKAMTMFEIRGRQFGVVERADMPQSARLYLASFARFP